MMTGRETLTATVTVFMDAPVGGTNIATMTVIDDERIERCTGTGIQVGTEVGTGTGIEPRKKILKAKEIGKLIDVLETHKFYDDSIARHYENYYQLPEMAIQGNSHHRCENFNQTLFKLLKNGGSMDPQKHFQINVIHIIIN